MNSTATPANHHSKLAGPRCDGESRRPMEPPAPSRTKRRPRLISAEQDREALLFLRHRKVLEDFRDHAQSVPRDRKPSIQHGHQEASKELSMNPLRYKHRSRRKVRARPRKAPAGRCGAPRALDASDARETPGPRPSREG